MKSLLKKIRPFIIPIVVTLVVLVLFHSIFMLGYVPTESMEPTLETGSLILGLRIFDELETGDIIIFRRDGSYLVKRIAACAGDTIDHQNSIVTVPDNCYYVLGDNAENSHDSRYWADQKFGRLTAKEVVRTVPGKGSIWRCECECGGEKKSLPLIY